MKKRSNENRSAANSVAKAIETAKFQPVHFSYDKLPAACFVNENQIVSFNSFMQFIKKTASKMRKGMEDRVILSKASSQAGQLEMLLIRENGATMEEMKEVRPNAAMNHIAYLRAHGLNIVYRNQRYYYEPCC